MTADAGIVIVDTVVFLNLLNVPRFNQHSGAVQKCFEGFAEAGADFELPIATVIESGNHIAQIPNGGARRRFANIFCDQVREALNTESPWTLTPLPNEAQLDEWLAGFPDAAMRKLSLGDLSIVKAWQAACLRRPFRRVRIWSLDAGLQGHDRIP